MSALMIWLFLWSCGGNQNTPYVTPLDVPNMNPPTTLDEEELPPPITGGVLPDPLGAPTTAEEDAPIDQPAVSFALSFLKALPVGKNASFSPASLRYAFGMTYAGANGNTAGQMEIIFGYTSESHAVLSNSLSEDASGVSFANRVYVDSRLTLEDDFKVLLRNEYGAALETLGFAASPESARNKINQWVDSSTNGNIHELLPTGSVTPNTSLVLVNALHFLGRWVNEFPMGATIEGVEFDVTPDRSVAVSMMRLKASFKYAETEHWQVVELPYSNDYGMLVFLPKTRHGLGASRNHLNFESYDNILDQIRPVDVYVSLPKFAMQETIPAKEILTKMGLVDAFHADKADFSRMTGTPELYVDNVYHQATVTVDEKGTEASAATAVVMNTRGGRHKPVPEMTVDHPFLFTIHNQKTKDILFVGQVVEP